MRAGLVIVAVFVAVLAGSAAGQEAILVVSGHDLQSAVDEAPPGSTLVLATDGVYSGTLTIAKDISLSAEQPLGKFPEHIDPLTLAYTENLSPQSPPRIVGSVVIQTGSVTLRGIDVSCNGDAAGVRVRAGNLMLTGCRILQAVGSGLAIESRGTAVAIGLTIYGSSGFGVVVEPGGVCALSFCYLWHNQSGAVQCHGQLAASDSVLSGMLPPPAPDGPTHGLTLGEGGTAWLERNRIGWNTGYGVAEAESGASGGLRGVENFVFPSFGPHSNSLGAYSEGDLPDGFLADGWDEPVEFRWHFAGQWFDLDVSLWVPLARETQEWPTARGRADARTEKSLSDLAHRLLALATASGFVEDAEIIEFVGAFIGQNIVYDYPRAESDEPGYHSPVTTLVGKSGVCRDYALLAAALLSAVGFDAAYVALPPRDEGDGHAVVGVIVSRTCDSTEATAPATCGQYALLDGKRYYLLETINPTPRLGDVPLALWGEPDVTPSAALYADRSLVHATAEIVATVPGGSELAAAKAFVRVTFRNAGSASTAELRARLQSGSSWWLGALAPGESRSVALVLEMPATGYLLLSVDWAGEGGAGAGWDVILLRDR